MIERSFSWRKIRVQVVEKGTSNESPSQTTLLGVLGSASQKARHTGAQGLLDEGGALGEDDDDPDE